MVPFDLRQPCLPRLLADPLAVLSLLPQQCVLHVDEQLQHVVVLGREAAEIGDARQTDALAHAGFTTALTIAEEVANADRGKQLPRTFS